MPRPANDLVAQARYLVTHVDEFTTTDPAELRDLRATAWDVLVSDQRRRKSARAAFRIHPRPTTGGAA